MKPNLLDECNDQRVPPREFMDLFCKRCRNPNCTNAGWASSSFEERVRTQVDRLLVNPYQARPEDSRFDQFRALRFMEIPAEVVLAKLADPWAGPQVHLATPSTEVTSNQMVEDAVAKLTGTPAMPTLVAVTPPVVPPPPVIPPVVQPPAINTSFPEEGVMIGGSNPPAVAPAVDPWAPKPKVNVVPRGSKIRMGE